MDIIFLDIDGVLRTHKSDVHWSKILNEPIPKNQFKRRFSPKAIENLNLIVQMTRAKIVISSTWRAVHSLDNLRRIFKENNFVGEIHGVTELLGEERGIEIQHFLDTSPVNSYCVIDDYINGIQEHIPDKRIVKCNAAIGLESDEIVDRVLEIL